MMNLTSENMSSASRASKLALHHNKEKREQSQRGQNSEVKLPMVRIWSAQIHVNIPEREKKDEVTRRTTGKYKKSALSKNQMTTFITLAE